MGKTVKLSSKRQIAIPRALCEKLHIKIGQELMLLEGHGHFMIVPKPKNFAAALEGLGKEIWEGIDPLEYIRKERASWDKHRLPPR